MDVFIFEQDNMLAVFGFYDEIQEDEQLVEAVDEGHLLVDQVHEFIIANSFEILYISQWILPGLVT